MMHHFKLIFTKLKLCEIMFFVGAQILNWDLKEENKSFRKIMSSSFLLLSSKQVFAGISKKQFSSIYSVKYAIHYIFKNIYEKRIFLICSSNYVESTWNLLLRYAYNHRMSPKLNRKINLEKIFKLNIKLFLNYIKRFDLFISIWWFYIQIIIFLVLS